MKVFCEIRHTLSEQFATAARLYAESVVSVVSQTSPKNYDQLWKTVEEAQLRSIQFGRAFKEHVASHHCFAENAGGEKLYRSTEQRHETKRNHEHRNE